MSDSIYHITIVLGTRPEIIKLAPIIRECEKRNASYSVIHTGQHYSENLNEVFFHQLDLPQPEYNLGVGSASHGVQTAEMIAGIEEILVEEESDVVLVQGDTNSVLAGTIAASKLDCEIGHIEAGLRSFDRDMPEETNRVLTDHAADYLFAPTEQSAKYLKDEGLAEERIYVTGNTVVDAVKENRELAARKSEVLTELDIRNQEYILLTAHRAENVDNEETLRNLFNGVARVANNLGSIIVYPIHPRTRERIDSFDVEVPSIVNLVPPQDYLDFLTLEGHASLILTDSGGVQEEACILGVPCVTLRENTERPETLDVGANQLVGTDPQTIEEESQVMIETTMPETNPFGDGTAAEQILDILEFQRSQEAVQ